MNSVRLRVGLGRPKDKMSLRDKLEQMAKECERELRGWKIDGAAPRVWSDGVFIGHSKIARIQVQQTKSEELGEFLLSVKVDVVIPGMTPGTLHDRGMTGITRPGKISRKAKEAIDYIRDAAQHAQQTLRLLITECVREAAHLGLPPDECVLAASEAVVREVMDS